MPKVSRQFLEACATDARKSVQLTTRPGPTQLQETENGRIERD